MLDATDAVTWLLWVVWAFAAGLYPVGLLLPGCACCGDKCDDLFDFARCIRFEAPNVGVIGTQYATANDVDMPTHGYSRAVRRPEDIGCVRVAEGYVMRFKDPWKQRQSETWNMNTEEVGQFLAGDISLTVQLAGEPGPWVVTVSDATALCGYSLCGEDTPFIGAAFSHGYVPLNTQLTPFFGDAIPQTVEFVATETLPATWSGQANQCFGQDQPVERNLRLSKTNETTCVYRSSGRTCESLSSSVRSYQIQAPLEWFFCGDLLWAIENGPCRSSLTLDSVSGVMSSIGFGIGGTFTLGGDDGSPWTNDWICPNDGGATGVMYPNGKCAPLSLDVNILRTSYVAFNLTAGGSYSSIGTIQPGTYVMSLLEATCTSQSYFVSVDGIGVLGINRSRSKWCDPWGAWTLRWNGTNWFVRNDDGTGYKWYGFLQPGVDYDPPQYQEIDTLPPSVDPAEVTISSAAQTVTVERCCPPRTEVISVPFNGRQYARTILAESQQPADRGVTVTITQAAADDSACEINSTNLVWVNGTQANIYDRIMPDDGCPLLAQVWFQDQPPCIFTVASGSEWLTAAVRDDKLIELTADAASIDQYNEWVNGVRVRSSAVTVFTGDQQHSWTVFQKAP